MVRLTQTLEAIVFERIIIEKNVYHFIQFYSCEKGRVKGDYSLIESLILSEFEYTKIKDITLILLLFI